MDFFSFVKPKNELESQPNEQQNVPFVPEEMWIKCPKCNSMLLTTDMEENCHICPMCGHHFRINARQRIQMLADENSFVEHDGDMQSQNILNFPGYEKKLEKARKAAQKNRLCAANVQSTALKPYFV